MKELILKLAIDVPHGFPWDRSLNHQNLKISKEEIIGYLREFDLNSFELRKELSWSIELEIYESGVNYSSLEDVKKNVKAKLQNFKRVYPYLNEELINHVLNKKSLNKEKNLDLFRRTLTNELTEKEKENQKELIKSWVIEIVSFNIMLGKYVKFDDIKEEVFKYLNSNFQYLNIEKEELNVILKKLGIGLGINIELFKSKMGKYKSRFEALIIKNDKEHKKEHNIEVTKESKDDLTESILGLFENMEEIEESEVKQQEVVKEKLENNNLGELRNEIGSNSENRVKSNNGNNIAEYKKEEKRCSKIVTNNDDIYNNMAALAQSLGYELLDNSKVQVSKDYYEKINSYKPNDEKIIKQLLSLDNGAVLSQLYNTYKNLNKIGLDNIEAVMSNFFSTLFSMGFEVNEDDSELGENVIVDTKNLFKEFLFSKPVNKDGEISGQVEYLSWKYKGKMIMPKIIKPGE